MVCPSEAEFKQFLKAQYPGVWAKFGEDAE
jgi:hypothetical protein